MRSFFGVKRTSAMDVNAHMCSSFSVFNVQARNGSECPCAPSIDRDLEDGEFSVNTAFFFF